MAVVYLQNKKGKWVRHNEFVALFILLLTKRRKAAEWIMDNWTYCACKEIRIPYHIEEPLGVDIS